MNALQDAFISYGRADSKQFAKYLNDRLVEIGYTIWFDFDDIPLGVDYQKQIDDGIEKSDNFIFIIGPHAVNSPYCALEIERAIALNKRIIPLLHVEEIDHKTWQQRYPHGTDSQWQDYQSLGKHSSFPNMHPIIRKINWIYFRENIEDFNTSLQGLIELFERQKIYVRQHTVLLGKALEWERNEKQSRYLLIGEERQRAESWLTQRFQHEQAPCTPTDLHCEYITESTKNANNLMTQVFLCHAEADGAVATIVRKSLMRSGITTWTHHSDIEFGSDFQAAMAKGMEEADNVVFLISSHSLASPYCSQEIDHALALHKRVIPMLIEAVPLDTLPEPLQTLQHIDLTHHQTEGDYQKDIRHLLRILKQDAAYYREHKILLTKALNWERQHYNPCILLRGYELQHALAWLKLAQQHPSHGAIAIQQQFIEASDRQPTDISLDVFISYSRADSDYARQLNDGLQRQGKRTWFDQESIASGADFQQEIYRGIAHSDNFVFVISPDSINSPYCDDEVNYAAGLNKRIIPILHRPIDSAALPPALKPIQWINYKDTRGDFYTHFSELVRTLDTDREHVRNHTKWSQRATEWADKRQDPDLLLRGSEFAIAHDWLQTALQELKQPPPTDLQKAFLGASQASIAAAERQEKRQKLVLRSLLGLMSFAFLVATGLSIGAFSLWRRSETAQLQAVARASKALFLADHKPEALITALRAGQNLSRLPEANQALVLSVLQQAVYGIQERQQLTNHGDVINDLAYAPDGELFASVSDDSTVKLWRQDGFLVQILDDHEDKVNRVSFSADGQRFATASADGTIKIWARDGLLLHSLDGHQGPIKGLDFNPNLSADDHGETPALASAGADGTVKLWNLSGALLRTFTVNSQGINQITFSPTAPAEASSQAPVLATAGEDGTLRLLSLEGELLQTFEGHRDAVEDVAFSPDGQLLASASRDRTAKLWRLNGQMLHSLAGHDSQVNAIAFAPDGQTLATAGEDHTVKLWSRNGEDLQTLSGHLTGVKDIAFAPHTVMLISGSADNTIKLWELTGDPLQRLKGHDSWVVSVAFSPDGETIATASGDHTVKLWNRQGEELAVLKGHSDWVNEVVFSADGEYLATASNDRTARLWSRSGEPLAIMRGHQDQVSSVAFSPTNGAAAGKEPLLATSSADQTIKLWNLKGEEQQTLKGHSAWVRSVAFSPDGNTIASTCAQNTLKLWNRQGELLSSARSHQNWVRQVTFSPDGQTIATASADNTVKLWNRQGQVTATLKGHDYWVLGVAFSPDGQTIATASADNTVKLWNRQGTELQTLYGHSNWVVDVAFSPDGKTLASASGDRTVILWHLQEFTLEAMLARGCRWLKNYDPEETTPEVEAVLNRCQEG